MIVSQVVATCEVPPTTIATEVVIANEASSVHATDLGKNTLPTLPTLQVSNNLH